MRKNSIVFPCILFSMDEIQMLPNDSSFWSDLERLGYLKCQFYFPGFPGMSTLPVSLDRLMKQVHLKTDGYIMSVSGQMDEENGCHKKITIQFQDHSGNVENVRAHIKSVPLLDVIEVMKGKYLPEKVVSCLPSRERELDRTYEKISDSNNQAYVDCLAGYVLSTLRDQCPGFPRFYGHFTGLTPQLRIDVTEDFYSIRNEAWFHRGIGSRFKIEVREDYASFKSGKQTREIQITDDEFGFTEELKEIAEDPNVIAQEWVEEDQEHELTEVYVMEDHEDSIDDTDSNIETDSEEENDTDEDTGSESDGDTDIGSESESDSEDDEPDEGVFFAIIPNMPVQSAIYENLEGPIDTLLGSSEITEQEWLAILFQITFSLAIAQKEYSFVHNDLHTNNVMWIPTDKEWIVYKVNNKVFKVPTFGKIIKIIDYGRSYYKYHNHEYLSDAYKSKGDAEGQYNYPPYYNPRETRVPPNPSFDLPRLACSMYEGLFSPEHDPDTNTLSAMLHRWLIDSRGKNILWNRNGDERFGGFLLYKHIARYCTNVIPIHELENNEFQQFITEDTEIIPEYTIRGNEQILE